MKIGDLGRVVTGSTPPSAKPEQFGNDFPFITPSDLSYSTKSPTFERRLSENGAAAQKRRALPPGSVAFTCIGATIGKSCLVSEISFSNQQINSIVVDRNDFSPDYVYYLLRHEAAGIKSQASGAATPIISKSAFEQIEITCSIPDLAVQRRIADILSAYDELIENNTRRIKILEAMAQSIYKEWFVNFRYPGHETVALVDSELGPIPSGWSVSTLDDVCSKITDGAHRSPATTTTGKPMASVKDMTPRSLSIASCRLISPEDFEVLTRQNCRPLAGDVLISKDGSFLKHVFPVFSDSPAVLLSSVAILRPSTLITATLLTLSLREPQNLARLGGFVSGAAIPRIVLKDFKLHTLVLPPDGVATRFESICEPLLREAVALESAGVVLRAMRDLLLPRLVSGEIDVADLDSTN